MDVTIHLSTTKVQGDAYYQDNTVWRTEDKLHDARDVTNSLGLDNVDVMSWFVSSYGYHKKTYNNEADISAGMAFTGALCGDHNVNMVERSTSFLVSAFVSNFSNN